MRNIAHKSFLEKLCKNNVHFREGVFKIIGQYKNTRTKLLIEDKYGEYLVNPRNILTGFKPSIKSAINKTEYFISQIKEVHGDKYNCNNVIYTKGHNKVELICHIHNKFEIRANGLLSGEGCANCARHNNFSLTQWKERAHTSKHFDSFKVYIIRCWNDEEEFYKIGRTYNTIEKRFKGKVLPYNFEVVSMFLSSAEDVYDKEVELHRINKDHKYIPNIKFRGMYECFDLCKNF